MSVLPPAEIDCPECNGDGWYQETESGHGCDGTPQSCAVRCPVPIPVQVECGACRGSGSIEISAAEARAWQREDGDA
jgi:DnaJ-class molecular chaperone